MINEHRIYHTNMDSENLKTIKNVGFKFMQIYLLQTRMFIIIDTINNFSFEKKAIMVVSNEKVQV